MKTQLQRLAIPISALCLLFSAFSQNVSRQELQRTNTALRVDLARKTNASLYGLSLPSLTVSRPAVLNASGNLTNATGTPDGTKFLRDDGTLAVPPGVSSLATNDNQFGANTTLTLKDGVAVTNLNTRGGTNFGAAPFQSDSGITTGDGTTYGAIGFLDASTGQFLTEMWTNVTMGVTNIYETPWPAGLGWCYQVKSTNGFLVIWTNGPCGGAAASSYWFDNASTISGSISSSVPLVSASAYYAADSVGNTGPAYAFRGHTNYGMQYESGVVSFYVNGNRGGYWHGNGALQIDAELEIGTADVALTRASAGVLNIDNGAGVGNQVNLGFVRATNITYLTATVAGVGGANTNFTVDLHGSHDLLLDAGTTNVNIVAFMNWLAGEARTVNVLFTNRTATVRTLSLGATTNNCIGMGILAFPLQCTNAVYASFKSMGSSNIIYGAQYLANPTN